MIRSFSRLEAHILMPMKDVRPKVVIGFYPRERFSAAAESLASIVRATRMPYTLVIVDAATPAHYRAAMQEAVRGCADARWITADRFLTSNESRNRIVAATDHDYVCFIENACVVEDGWLAAMVDACETHPAGAASPQLRERTTTGTIPHHDYGFADIAVRTQDGRTVRRCVNDLAMRHDRFASTAVHEVRTAESHCQLFSRAVLAKLGPFDETITVGTHIDVSCALLDKGIAMVQVPASKVTHLPTVFLRDDERAFFAFRWDVRRATESRDTLRHRWNFENMADLADFAKGQAYRVHPLLWNAYRLLRLPKTLRQRYLTRV
jgi:hypothetical protein